MNVVELKSVTRTYGDFVAVDRLSLAVREGEIFALLGPNGAGKSTTIHMIASLLRVTEGTIEILGKNIAAHRRFAKQQIGLVPQDIAIYEDMTAYENVQFFAGLYGLRGKELRQRTEEALAFVGLEDRLRGYPKHFSGGMKRRLNIACAIAHRPRLVIMDEPTVGIDPQSRQYILNAIRKLNAMGCTIIYSSHYMEEVEELCTRIAIMDHGKIIAEGTKEQLTAMIAAPKSIRVEVRTETPLDTEKLRNIAGVRSVEFEGQTLTIGTDTGVNNLNLIIRRLVDDGVDIRALDAHDVNLETVFLTLTGRSLRDT